MILTIDLLVMNPFVDYEKKGLTHLCFNGKCYVGLHSFHTFFWIVDYNIQVFWIITNSHLFFNLG